MNSTNFHLVNEGPRNQTAPIDSRLSIRYVDPKLGYAKRETSPTTGKLSCKAFKPLRTLPGYTLGDTLRKEEMILCCDKEATSFALDTLRPNDCAFVLRSDGCFRYAVFEGHANGNASYRFRVDDDGKFKVVPLSHFCDLVKIPTLPISVRVISRGTARLHPMSRSLISRRATVEEVNKPNSSKPISVSLRKGNRFGTRSGMNPELHSSLPPMHITNELESKTEDGDKSVVQMYQVGMDVLYKGETGSVPASILGVHLNQFLEPNYTVRLMDGQEVETDNDHIASEPLFSRGNINDVHALDVKKIV